MFFLTPKFVKRGRLYIKEARKRLAYNRDLWNGETIAAFEREIERLENGVKAREERAVKTSEETIEKLCGQHCPLPANASICENVEVILVAVIVALGIRTYLLQPFTIPTSSMYPTLNGIIGKATKEEPPGIAVRILHTAFYGRTWHNVVALADESVIRVAEEKRGGLYRFFTYTRVDTSAGNTYWINETEAPVRSTFAIHQGRSYKEGDPIARGYTDTGDHVFVDKVSYHFRKPTRGEVFVFITGGIEPMGNPGPPPRKPSQFYIKRLAALPNDRVSIRAPELFINAKRAEAFGFDRVMRGGQDRPVEGGYRGYSQGPRGGLPYNLSSPDVVFQVPPDGYFALGDNSYSSSDSRAWGHVPAENLMGPGLFVYWPFANDTGSHFGLIK